MKALLVDDDITSRRLLRLALSRRFDWGVVEAADGMEALRILESEDIGIVFLDMHMPMMDGIEMLEVLRASPRHAALPVIMLTSENDADMVRQVVGLGVIDYLVKPLSPARIGSRVGAALARLTASPPPRTADSNGTMVTLIIDRDADLRQFVATVMAPSGPVILAESGVEALRICDEREPALVLVGAATGLLPPALLVQRLRAKPTLASSAIYLLMTQAERDHSGEIAGVDGWIRRTFVAEAFLAQVDELRAARPGSAAAPARQLKTIADHVLGMMLNGPLETVAMPEHEPVDGIEAEVELTAVNGDRWALAVQCPLDSAQRLSATASADANDDRSGAGAVAGLLAGRLQHVLRERGITATCTEPDVKDTAWPPRAARGEALCLRADGITIGLSLTQVRQPAATHA